jgi:transposase
MPKPLVTDEPWAVIEPLLPQERPKPKGGRPRVGDRAVLRGILFVLKTGIPWEMLPQEMDCGSGMTCWRRLKEWHEAGVWRRLHRVLLDRLGKEDHIDWSMLEELVDAIEPIRRPPGRPRKRPQKLHADKAYDAKKCRKVLRKRGIKARIARRGKESSEKLGRYRWVVERTLS